MRWIHPLYVLTLRQTCEPVSPAAADADDSRDPRLLWLSSPSLFFTDLTLCAAIRADKTEQSLRIIHSAMEKKKQVCVSTGEHHSPVSHLSILQG